MNISEIEKILNSSCKEEWFANSAEYIVYKGDVNLRIEYDGLSEYLPNLKWNKHPCQNDDRRFIYYKVLYSNTDIKTYTFVSSDHVSIPFDYNSGIISRDDYNVALIINQNRSEFLDGEIKIAGLTVK